MNPERLTTLLILTGMAVGSAQAAESPPEAGGDANCQQTLEHLHTQEEAQRAARQRGGASVVGGALAAARRQAARACLGGRSVLPAPPQRVQPPLSVPSVSAPAAAESPSALVRPATPPVGVIRGAPPSPALSTVSQCDSAGCWTSDGSYLLRVGPTLAGPPGLCSSLAGILSCR